MERKETLSKYFSDYRQRLFDLFDSVDLAVLEQLITTMIDTFKSGKTLYIVGNGGSAATASHMQSDFSFFVRNFTQFRPKVRALTDNIPMMTAVGNDNSFDDVFVEQMKGIFEKGDVLLAISASGNSPNAVKAVEYAKELGGKTMCFVGFTGGKLKEISDIALHTPNAKGDYGPIEDLHMILDHLIVNYFSVDDEFLEIK